MFRSGAAYATANHGINLTGLVASPDGRQIIKVRGQGGDAEELGRALAHDAISQGASEILELGPVK